MGSLVHVPLAGGRRLAGQGDVLDKNYETVQLNRVNAPLSKDMVHIFPGFT